VAHASLKILLLSFYYTPDIGPGPVRAKSLVDSLVEVAGPSLKIDVLTTQPNRYQSLDVSAALSERFGNVSITRFQLPTHKSGMADQAKAFIAFAKAVLKATKGKQYDLVLATSSRLMTAALGAWVAKRIGAKLYLDIRDLFTDTMEDVLAKSPLRVFMSIFRVLESQTFRAANKINVVSAGFAPHIEQVSPSVQISTFTNGIDEEFLNQDYAFVAPNSVPLVLYAGNIGDGQGLHNIIPNVASALQGKAQFRLIGDGGKKKLLENILVEQAISNAQLANPIPRAKLFDEYRTADILFLHLNDYKAFRKVLPSKIFEYAATGKPILAGVGGYAADFLRDQVPGVEVFDPCDSSSMRIAIHRLLSGPRTIDRSDFCSRYLRRNIMRDMAKDILSLARAAV
jgi:glycosyltransferase involved in cell wall biosynthesis